jgi:hypothetical protein
MTSAEMNGLSSRDAAIVNMTQAGISGPAVAAQFGVTVRTVQRARSRAGVCKPPPARFTDDEIKLAERLFEDGASYGEIARTLGRFPSVIVRRFPNRSTWARSTGGHMSRMFAQLERITP